MNQENLKFLQDRLFYLGTEKKLFDDLEKKINQGEPAFTLAFSNHYEGDNLTANLHFRKSDNTDMYFLNRYDASLQKPAQMAKNQTFYLDAGKGITMKEAYNLLDGRSVNKDLKNKDGLKYNAWVKLDFDNKDQAGNAKLLQYHRNYGYDLHSELFKLPIQHMTSEAFTQLSSSLEKGNLQTLKLSPAANEQMIQVAANPQFKTLDLYDAGGKPLSKEEKSNLSITAELAKSEMLDRLNPRMPKIDPVVIKQEVEKHLGEVKSMVPASSTSKETKKIPDQKRAPESLLPKKSTGKSKGLSL